MGGRSEGGREGGVREGGREEGREEGREGGREDGYFKLDGKLLVRTYLNLHILVD